MYFSLMDVIYSSAPLTLSRKSHAPRVFGFSARLKMSTYLARPVSDLISNALQSPFLTEDQRRMTARAVYKAFSRQMGGELKALDQLLGAEICRVIA